MVNLKHLGEEIIQKGFDQTKFIERISARAIIFNEKKEVLFVYSKFYDDVSFPGGGVDPGESMEQALKRECLEEVGAIIDSYEEYYKITEKRAPSNTKQNIFTSYYFICTSSEYTKNSLLPYEIELGYETVWMNIEDAINLNTNTLKKLIKNKKYTGVVERELRILNQLKQDY